MLLLPRLLLHHIVCPLTAGVSVKSSCSHSSVSLWPISVTWLPISQSVSAPLSKSDSLPKSPMMLWKGLRSMGATLMTRLLGGESMAPCCGCSSSRGRLDAPGLLRRVLPLSRKFLTVCRPSLLWFTMAPSGTCCSSVCPNWEPSCSACMRRRASAQAHKHSRMPLLHHQCTSVHYIRKHILCMPGRHGRRLRTWTALIACESTVGLTGDCASLRSSQSRTLFCRSVQRPCSFSTEPSPSLQALSASSHCAALCPICRSMPSSLQTAHDL